MSALFALTLAVGAALLFAVQPMAARMALPILGGSPSVWNTCMVFFQASVLGGYLAAHLLARVASLRMQLGCYLGLIAFGGLVLPTAIEIGRSDLPEWPTLWLLGRLSAELALPALGLATAGPLLQRWFAQARIPADGPSREPYVLYSASNLGSLGALAAYPWLIEPRLDLAAQSRAWTAAYAAWGLLVLACGARVLRGGVGPRLPATSPSVPTDDVAGSIGVAVPPPPTAGRLFLWALLAAVPASLLQGCTLFLGTDVAAVPLLWVIPLALYLGTYVIAFAHRGPAVVRVGNRSLPFLATALFFVIVSRATQPVLLVVGLHLLFLFAAGLVCHGRLVALRPDSRHLTAFYLALAAGGVAGGGFNALIAPHLFSSVAEYPAAIALACAFLPARGKPSPPSRERSRPAWPTDLAWVAVVGLGMLVLGLVVPWWTAGSPRWRDAVVFGLPAVACAVLSDRPRRLAATLGAAFLAGLCLQSWWTHTEFADRNFFGITRVTRDAGRQFHQLVHGNTIHGRQFADPARRQEPLAYYHRLGPVGRIFEGIRARIPSASTGAPLSTTNLPGLRIGVIGLGVGSMAAYARPGDDWTFFEIDPAVIRVARETNWFTFLADAATERLRIVEGDARLRLREVPDGDYDLLVLDAFSSDAIPVHLLTREALALYRSKLRPGGWLAAHISNRYLALEPVFAALARDAGWACRSSDDLDGHPDSGKEPSHWILMARDEADLGRLARQSLWLPAEGADRAPVWTDQRTALWPLFDWE